MFESAAIFLAEDSPADVYLFREALKAHGIESDLFVFDDGGRAISFLSKAENDGPQPQLFVLDLNLPKINGQAILRHIRHSARFSRAPVVILTSSDDPADRAETAELGASCYIKKPSNVADFLDIGRTIKSLLRVAASPSTGSGATTTAAPQT
jgi:DNA-binding response OmpR family regulator